MEYIIKNPLDEHTCLHCATQVGKDVVTVEESVAAAPNKLCTNEDGCRCYVALDVEETNNTEVVK